jgi:hypothetical protein
MQSVAKHATYCDACNWLPMHAKCCQNVQKNGVNACNLLLMHAKCCQSMQNAGIDACDWLGYMQSMVNTWNQLMIYRTNCRCMPIVSKVCKTLLLMHVIYWWCIQSITNAFYLLQYMLTIAEACHWCMLLIAMHAIWWQCMQSIEMYTNDCWCMKSIEMHAIDCWCM